MLQKYGSLTTTTIMGQTVSRRIDFFDFESTGLKGTFAQILVACFLSLDGKDVVTFRLDNKKYKPKKRFDDDSKLIEAVRDYMEESFCWVSWYGKMFDVPLLQTRLALHGMKPLERRLHVDLLYYSRKPNLLLHSSRLDSVAKSFQFKTQKTDLLPDAWMAARSLEKKAMDTIVEHCQADVQVLGEAWDVLSPFVRNIHY